MLKNAKCEMMTASILASVAIFTGVSAHAAAPTKSQDWRLWQKSRTFGMHSVLVSPIGFRITNTKSKVSYIAKAPAWDVYVTNDITKVYHVQKFDKFQRLGTRAMVLFGEPVFTTLGMKPTAEKVTSCGQGCLAYVTTPQSERFQVNEVQDKRQNNRAPVSANLKLSIAIPSGDRAGIILDRIYGLPEVKGIPLEFMYKTIIGKQKVELVTEKIEHAKSKPADFVMPSNYRKVNKPEEVFKDDISNASVDNMIQNMERGGEFNYDLQTGFGRAK